MNSNRLSALTDENAILKCKVEALEGMVMTVRREMQSVKVALGPWYRPQASYPSQPQQERISDGQFRPYTRSASSANLSHTLPSADYADILVSPNASTSTAFDALAPYFPPAADDTVPWPEQRLGPVSFSSGDLPADVNGHSYRESMLRTPVAPINLSTTIEGSLGGIRESIVTLSASVDSLMRRHDIELRNETLRMNEEISRLTYTLNGLRMQVHSSAVLSVEGSFD